MKSAIEFDKTDCYWVIVYTQRIIDRIRDNHALWDWDDDADDYYVVPTKEIVEQIIAQIKREFL